MNAFKIVSDNSPQGDQIQAIRELVAGLNRGEKHQTLLGVTGSGKTFSIANAIAQTNRPTIILSHNKTLAAQLYSEFKELFPDNRVEYFVSYFDYYRPEAYLPQTDTYIDKTSKQNWDLEAMRMSAMNSLLTRNDTIVVASVAAIYGTMNPLEYKDMFIDLQVGQTISRKKLITLLVSRNYVRNNLSQDGGTFRVRGEVIDVVPGSTNEHYVRIELFGDEIVKIETRAILENIILERHQKITLFPAVDYPTRMETIRRAVEKIKIELAERVTFFQSQNKLLEVQRLSERVKHDIDALNEFGICPGIENYSRHMEGRAEGQRSFSLFDYLPKNGLVVIDESHMSIPQIHGMFNADYSRKRTLVDYGFRLPSALDNRPLKFFEFESFDFPKIYVSATPAPYEIDKSNGVVVSQIIRPTGLLDPVISVVPADNQVEFLHDTLQDQVARNERTFILTLTIRMAEELTKYLQSKKFKVAYLHNELKTLERAEILRKLRKGVYDIVVGINLLREGIDVPEISLVCILDADKESFFRSTRALIQIIGRAARNENGRVYFFANRLSDSMQEAMDITSKRRTKQIAFNQAHNIIPKTIVKRIPDPIQGADSEVLIKILRHSKKIKQAETTRLLNDLRAQMLKASKELDYERAIELRDIILEIEADLA